MSRVARRRQRSYETRLGTNSGALRRRSRVGSRNEQDSLTEVFTYDNLFRLDYSTLNGTQNLNVDYNALGNITSKSDVGGG